MLTSLGGKLADHGFPATGSGPGPCVPSCKAPPGAPDNTFEREYDPEYNRRAEQYARVCERINAIDLSMVKTKLCLPVEMEGKGWTTEKADHVERLYKQFLKLSYRYYAEKPIVPTKAIDEMWHAHILDTQAYDADCQKAFGFKLHHYPYFGIKGEQDAKDLDAAYADTRKTWMTHFGIDPVGDSSSCSPRCSGGKCMAKCA